MDFLVPDWSTSLHSVDYIKEKQFFVSGRSDAYRIFCRNELKSIENTPEICSNQEADTKMFFCAAFTLTLGFNSVCIVTVDTDVLILGCYYSGKLDGKLFIKLLTKLGCIFDFSEHKFQVRHFLDTTVTGCYYRSSYYGFGKLKGLKLIKESESLQDAFMLLGTENNVSSVCQDILEEFV